MGHLSEKVNIQEMGFEFNQDLPTICPGENVQVQFCGTADLMTAESGAELGMVITKVWTNIGGTYKTCVLPADQNDCGPDMQHFLAHIRNAVRKSGWPITPEMRERHTAGMYHQYRVTVHGVPAET